MSEPAEPKKTKSVAYDAVAMGPVKAVPEGFTRWDKFVVREGNLTCAQFAQWLKEKHGLDVSMITVGKFILYYPMVYKSHKESRGPRPLKDVFLEVSQAPLPAGRTYLTLELSLR